MRTAKLAKYKTAIQMTGVGYVILFMAHQSRPDHLVVWFFMIAPMLMPAGLILYRALKRKQQGPRSATMLALMLLCFLLWWLTGPDITTILMIYSIGALTVISGFSYFKDAWSALVGKADSTADIFRFLLEGVLLPVLFVILFQYYNSAFTSAAVILVITLELAVGGLQNLLASEKIAVPFGRSAGKSVLQIGLAAAAVVTGAIFGPGGTIGTVCIGAALVLTVLYAAIMFAVYRKVYLTAI